MSTNIATIEQAIHPQRMALLDITTVVKREDPIVNLAPIVAASSEHISSSCAPHVPVDAELEDGEIVEGLGAAPCANASTCRKS